MAVLAEKWTLLIVTQLANGPMRTAEIRRGVDGVSEKMLIQTLRKLEGFGLISRKSYPEVPPRVEYRLTALGRSLSRLAGLFSRWVERNAANLLKAEQQATLRNLTLAAPVDGRNVTRRSTREKPRLLAPGWRGADFSAHLKCEADAGRKLLHRQWHGANSLRNLPP